MFNEIYITICILTVVRCTDVLIKETKYVEPREIHKFVSTTEKDLEPLLNTQKKVINDLDDYIKYEKKRLNIVEKHLELLKREHDKAIADIPKYLGNSINAYTLIKGLTSDLEFIERTSSEPMYYKRDLTQRYPSEEDLDGSIQRLVQLQRFYLLNATTVAGGTFNRYSSSPMTASDCFEIAIFLNNHGDFRRAIEWFIQAYDKYDKKTPEAHPFMYDDLIKHIAFAYDSIDDIRNALKWLKELIELDPRSADTETIELVEQYEKQIAAEDGSCEKTSTDPEEAILIFARPQAKPSARPKAELRVGAKLRSVPPWNLVDLVSGVNLPAKRGRRPSGGFLRRGSKGKYLNRCSYSETFLGDYP